MPSENGQRLICQDFSTYLRNYGIQRQLTMMYKYDFELNPVYKKLDIRY